MKHSTNLRSMVVVLGDQLDSQSAAFDDFDPKQDVVWMAEVAGEATHVWSSKSRIALFLAAMRHFRDELRSKGIRVHYREFADSNNSGSLGMELSSSFRELVPEKVVLVEPGEWRVREELLSVVEETGVAFDLREDRHFLCSIADFKKHAQGRKQLRMEFFYREMRGKHGVLMDGDEPEGGDWNYDAENRSSFGRSGPGDVPKPMAFMQDKITREVIDLIDRKFTNHPGSLEQFDWPVTSEHARRALTDFIKWRLPHFGRYQDAMWADDNSGNEAQDAYLYHSRLSAALNLKLLNPREVIEAAENAYRERNVPLASAEGFIRQILGWREYVRGIYWLHMPGYLEMNALKADEPLPEFYWTGRTEMNCLRVVINQTLNFGYAHHIQRLMVTGLFALLLGVRPKAVHDWYLAVYVDAVEWVELPNTLGMSQYGDGGLMASKPYVASGKYIQRMSNYCEGCRFNPAKATGEDACPFTTLYWDFLMRHEKLLRKNPRMRMQLKNLDRLKGKDEEAIRKKAKDLRKDLRNLDR